MLKLKVHEDSKPTVIWKTALGKEIVTTIYISTSIMAFVALTKAARFNQMWDPSANLAFVAFQKIHHHFLSAIWGPYFLDLAFRIM